MIDFILKNSELADLAEEVDPVSRDDRKHHGARESVPLDLEGDPGGLELFLEAHGVRGSIEKIVGQSFQFFFLALFDGG